MDKRIRVLVVDDEPRICRLILDVLVQEGYMVDVSFSGADALQMIRKYNYHLLITDLEMPGIDGLELIQKVKKRDPDIRAIMITGNAIDDIARWSLRYGIDNTMQKPFNITELKRVVKQVLCTHKIILEKM
jgi:DNA-binding response OmpR family regulator